MKKSIYLAIALAFTLSAGRVNAQTLFVPSGTSGIGTSSVTGKVGIGFSAPAEAFHINGNIRGNQVGGALRVQTQYGYVDFGPKNASCAQFYTDRPLYYFDKEIRVNGMIGSYSGDLFLGCGGTSVVTIKTNTVSVPFSASFSVGNSINEGVPRIKICHNGNNGYFDYCDNLYFRADKNWISSLILQGDGNVAIGFDTGYDQGIRLTQGYKLAVNGSVLCENINIGHSTATNYKLAVNGGISCDNIAIGTTNTQGYKFAVNGNILCEGVKVIADVPNSDYVFNNDYKLLNLPMLERFVKENNHLPEVPSAEEFKKNGYSVGEMDNLLLKKVEELTLYVIEINKKLETLQKENELLKQKQNK